MLLDPKNPLAAEILQETAESYFAACRKMVASLDALASVLPVDSNRARLLEDAAEKVHSVVIQREAMNLKCDAAFFDDYGISNEVRSLMGRNRPD